jgi:hypothetical protein
MKQASRKIIAMIIVSLWILPFGILVGSSQVFAFGGSVQVTITGTFIAQKAKGDINVYMLTVHDEKTMLKKLFKVTDIEAVEGNIDGRTILEEVFPPAMHLIGDKEATQFLRQDDIVGKSYTIAGTLHEDDGILFVDFIKKAVKGK